MDIKKLKWFTIIKDALFFYLLLILLVLASVISLVSIDQIFFDGKYSESFSEPEIFNFIEGNIFGLSLLSSIYIMIFATIYRSGKSDPQNRLAHMGCVAILLWIFPGLGLASEFTHFIWKIFNLIFFILCIFVSDYLYKKQKHAA